MGMRSEKKKKIIGKPPVRHRKFFSDTIFGVTRPSIRRLARRGGVKRLSSTLYEEVRRVIRQFLELIVRDVVTYTEHRKQKTVGAKDVLLALRRHGRPLYGYLEK